jgi:aminoglycoside 6'-N-acetyltransferase
MIADVTPLSFRPLTEADLPQLGRWLEADHVRAWWQRESSLEHLRKKYLPRIHGREPTEVFVIVLDAHDIGIIQRYRLNAYPPGDGEVAGTGLAFPRGAGIDYLIGVPEHVGRGIGTQLIQDFTELLFADYTDVEQVVVTPQHANGASCRVLEKAGYSLRWTGQLDSDDPTDSGTAALYVRDR